MIQSGGYDGGSVDRAVNNIRQNLNPDVQQMFQLVITRIRDYLNISSLYLSAPSSERWITVKLHPRKAVLALRDEPNGNLKFDIDTYAHNDIRDTRGLFQMIPNPAKPNKRHVAFVTPNTSDIDLDYFVEKMIEGMRLFES